MVEEENHHERHKRDFGIIPIPAHLIHNPSVPFHFGLTLNIAFGVTCTFVVANLYYCQPLLIELSKSFNVTYSEVSRIPTLIQAGYATGLVFITPLGDLVRRRQLILILLSVSTCLTIPLAVTKNLLVFEIFSFFIGVSTVTPQVLIPLAADLSPAKRRATAISIVLSGLILGVLIARVISGIIAQYTSWRVVYYVSLGMQSLVLVGGYLMLPDYPAKNTSLTYWHILYTMGRFCITEPLLIQACLIEMAVSACFSNFWITLTFLLGGDPYNYSTLVIGLFGLVGIFGVAMGPLVGRAVDKLVPWYATLLAILCLMCFLAIQVGAGGIHIAAVIFATFGLDVFDNMIQISLATAIFSIEPEARARLNAVFIFSLFLGQVMGTSAGTKVFVRYGWRAGAALSLGWAGWQLFVLLLRGPHCECRTWFGYEGGIEARKGKLKEELNDIDIGKVEVS
ncbi:MFS superfamily [Desarmillaria tabescens]|uniref:MFS superfamily n=1 Tax=Armillaria tabescens TaxID=1929756 RepID=A0AA39KF86_ARMTA|nr:MFS superfamily [Desarmillaria tabescens]KAK0460015.1 MFS superfamily [Desarmillaria tabescens]